MYLTVSQLLNNPCKLSYLNDQYMQEVFRFKDHDILFLKLFWHPGFDELWILLDEPFIEAWLIKDNNLTLNRLYQQVLTMFHRETDYRFSTEDNHENMYMVKGYCLKDLCLICNKLFRDFFVRLARVAHMLMLTKSIDDNSLQMTINKTAKQVGVLSQKTDNLTFLIDEIVGKRVEEIAKRVVVSQSDCEEVINLVRLPSCNDATSPLIPVHLRNAGYVVIRCLRKNYAKHLNRIKSYGNLINEEVFKKPIENRGINLVSELRDMGVKTHKSNGISSDDHVDLIEKVKAILEIEDKM